MRTDENELPKKKLRANLWRQRGRGRLKSRWIDGVDKDARKLGCIIWLHGIEVAGDICWRRPWPTEGCKADDDDDDDDDDDVMMMMMMVVVVVVVVMMMMMMMMKYELVLNLIFAWPFIDINNIDNQLDATITVY